MINPEGVSISRASGGDPGRMQASANVPAAGAQFTGYPCDFAGASNTCVSRNNIGHGRVYGLVNCGQPQNQRIIPWRGRILN